MENKSIIMNKISKNFDFDLKVSWKIDLIYNLF